MFTAVQVAFNNYVAELFKNIVASQKSITKYVTDLDGRVAALQSTIERSKVYESIYWEDNKDKFYQFHQNAFRGEETNIKEYLKVYLEYLNKPDFYEKFPFVDIGCGRGEFLEILKENKIKSFGVDVNEEFVKELKEKKLSGINSDALGYLILHKEELGGVSAFHLVEHFTFPQLFDFIYLIKERLVKGGICIFETPNPDNLTVGAEHFYNDFSHITKLPPLLLIKTMEFAGFSSVKMLSLHPEKKEFNKSEVERRLFGPMDYAIVATK